ncbi:MAG: L-seryl-tRNA(Sec) selenium transferase [Deltaproteobacteria bacterium]|nr:L-seryl-tRNA(Sec) selenium transferase [Deltaproteobacteria bacterium]
MPENRQALFRKIPSVDVLLAHPQIEEALSGQPRVLVIRAIHEVLETLRAAIQGEVPVSEERLETDVIVRNVLVQMERLSMPSLRNVINATGVVVHTNLGRSLLADRVLAKFRPLAGGYSNLEYSLSQGRRGSRYTHVEYLLKELTGAQAGMVVNNNAAAVLLSLETLAKGKEVVVSRGQLVEIGGAFRIPDVMRKSGATMVEVGTTNKTHLRDYEEAIGPDTALLLKVHTSNFQIVGFTEEVPLSDLVKLGQKYGIPVMDDLGSGCLVDFSTYGMIQEPTVQDALEQGVGVITFSGDKLLGGPQAGIILGKNELVKAIRENQLTRALRIDKLTLLALEETLRMYRDPRMAVKEIPTLRMICASYEWLFERAEQLHALIQGINTENFSIEQMDGDSKVGGGALPLQKLRTRLISLVPAKLSAQKIEERLRHNTPPVIGRVEKDRLMLDVRTIQESDFQTLAQAIKALAQFNPKTDRSPKEA